MALNEEPFVKPLLDSLYPFCSAISIITQYDRDFYARRVDPDATVKHVIDYPDPDGKISLAVRRYQNEAAARNHEMLCWTSDPASVVTTEHGIPLAEVRRRYEPPDYFLIVDADEIYDVDTMPAILDYLEKHRPRGMRVTAWQYRFTWNERIPLSTIRHHHFGFVKAGLLFEHNRVITWNEQRAQKLFNITRIPLRASKLWDFIDCPTSVGMFHHGAYLGGRERLVEKFAKHSHPDIVRKTGYIDGIEQLPFDKIPTSELPRNIREAVWPSSFLSR